MNEKTSETISERKMGRTTQTMEEPATIHGTTQTPATIHGPTQTPVTTTDHRTNDLDKTAT